MVHVIPADASQLFDTAVFNAQVPREGPKSVAMVFPFTDSITSFQVNMLLTTSQQYLSLIQSAIIDNSLNSEPLSINISVINWTVKIPPFSQAQISLTSPKNCIFTVTSEGAVFVPIQFLNVPIAAAVWSVGDQGGQQAIPVAAGTAQIMGASGGAIGDELNFITIIPGSLSPGAVTIEDGGSGAVTIFAGGASSVSSLVPFVVPIEALSRDGPWTVTTGGNVTALVNGEFT